MNHLVSADWLHKNLNDSALVILDASMDVTISCNTSGLKGQVIPNARKFDLKNNFSDKKASFPNTVPSVEQFETECQKLGIDNTSRIVIYDTMGVYSSPRVWWLFRVMGHKEVAVLDGGLPEWVNNDHAVANHHIEQHDIGNFKANFKEHMVKNYEEIVLNIEKNDFLVVDARSKERFNGTTEEPRKHLKSGHIPNSVNIPYQEVLSGRKYKSKEELKELFEKRTDNSKPLVFSCGSGLTACIVMLGHELVSNKSYCQIFDGSWTEWAERQQLFTGS